jgi:hypothetical protein
MKKEFILLFSLTISAMVVYVLLPFSENQKKNDKELAKNYSIPAEDINAQKINDINLTFDVVRINKNGDVIIAGKTLPDTELYLFDGNDKLATLNSDSHGDWMWMSEDPLKPGIKRFNLKLSKNKENFSSQNNVIILVEKNKPKFPKIIKFSSNDNAGINILTSEKKLNGLGLDTIEYYEDKKLKISGRATPNSKIELFLSDIVYEETFADLDGVWKIELNEIEFLKYELKIETHINNEKIAIKTSILEDFKSSLLIEKKIVVEDGNSLWRIAKRTLGGGIYYSEIYKNNIKKINNPDLIFPGQVFNIPKIKK